MKEKDAENLRDIITEIESIAGNEPIIKLLEDLDNHIKFVLVVIMKKERPPKHDGTKI